MSSPADLSAGYTLIPLAVVLVGASVWWLRRTHQLTAARMTVGVVAAVYIATLLRLTFFPFPLDFGSDHAGVAWYSYINKIPLTNTEPSDMADNVLLFVPFGILLPLMTAIRSWRSALVVGVLASLTIESLQLLTDLTLGAFHAADVNDLLANMIGALVGYLGLATLARWSATSKAVSALRWRGRTKPAR